MSELQTFLKKAYDLGVKHSKQDVINLIKKKAQFYGNHNDCGLVAQSALLALIRDIEDLEPINLDDA